VAIPIQTSLVFLEPLSKKDAMAVGKDRYFTGRPCKYGHVAERNVVRGDCVECINSRGRAWRLHHPERSLAILQRCKEKHAEKYRKADRLRYENRDVEMARKRNKLAMRKWRAANPVPIAEKQAQKANERERLRWRIAGRPRPTQCDICGAEARGKIEFEHCHKTLVFRGWVCTRCNQIIGYSGDSPKLLMRVCDYLESAKRSAIPVPEFCWSKLWPNLS
jgi:recombination endonuclease VII